ncbi:MAG: TatD family hydrolase [Prolixibacteraceae bacterium]
MINLHTHFKLPEGQTGLVSHPVQVEFLPEPGQYYSIGLHPWSVNEPLDGDWIAVLAHLSVHPQVLAIGECGLDRSIETPLSMQEAAFTAQAELAEKQQLPVILHAVRSYADLLQIKKSIKTSVAWILHGYQGNPETTVQLAGHDFYFSFGASLLKDLEKLNQSLRQVPSGHLFFETDESEVPVESIYNFAASVLKIPVEELKISTGNNFKSVFKKWETGRNGQH